MKDDTVSSIHTAQINLELARNGIGHLIDGKAWNSVDIIKERRVWEDLHSAVQAAHIAYRFLVSAERKAKKFLPKSSFHFYGTQEAKENLRKIAEDQQRKWWEVCE